MVPARKASTSEALSHGRHRFRFGGGGTARSSLLACFMSDDPASVMSDQRKSEPGHVIARSSERQARISR
jgi:hypothetical protein